VLCETPVLKERAVMMTLTEGITYKRDAEKRGPCAKGSLNFIDRNTNQLSKKMVLTVKNGWGKVNCPWSRKGFQRQTSADCDLS
jgi:hypothetical protein